jgi:hypothetical protein
VLFFPKGCWVYASVNGSQVTRPDAKQNAPCMYVCTYACMYRDIINIIVVGIGSESSIFDMFANCVIWFKITELAQSRGNWFVAVEIGSCFWELGQGPFEFGQDSGNWL